MLLLDCLYWWEVRVCMKRSLQILGVLWRLEGARDQSCTCCTRLLWWKRISTWMWNSHFIGLSLTSGNTIWVETKRIKSWIKAAVVYFCYRKSGRTPRAETLPTSPLKFSQLIELLLLCKMAQPKFWAWSVLSVWVWSLPVRCDKHRAG